jgi:DNA ligase-1
VHKFALVCEQISQTTKRLEKERILSEYLRSLNDEDLQIAAIFFSGSPFALRDQRSTNVGFAAIRGALQEIDPQIVEQLDPVLLRTGDLGTAIEELFRPRNLTPALTLKDVLLYFELLTTASTNQQKREWTRDILSRATALEAKYIIKVLLGGMRIGLQESLVESSLAKAFGRPLPQVQYANMLLGDIAETAFLARYDRLAEARMRLLHPLKPMLASPEEDVDRILKYMDGKGLVEDKYDGIRAQIHKQDHEVKIYSRDLDDITRSFPDIVASISQIPVSVLLDGEIVPYQEGRILGFAELQTRLGRKVLTEEILNAVPCRYFAFDLLYKDEELFLSSPLHLRRSALALLQTAHPAAFELAVQHVVSTPEEIEQTFTASRSRNNEGLVIKHPESAYTPGKRGKSWLKLKRAEMTLDVVVVLAEYGHGKRRGLLSDYTFSVQKDGELLTIGKAYSGITDKELDQLSELFHRISIRNGGYYHVVPPQVVFEVTFDRINRSNRHSSGFALRFPRIKRIRWDKKPEEIDTLETVEKLYLAQ